MMQRSLDMPQSTKIVKSQLLWISPRNCFQECCILIILSFPQEVFTFETYFCFCNYTLFGKFEENHQNVIDIFI